MIWIGVIIIGLGIELMTIALISIWFAIGAGFALGAQVMGYSLIVQSVVFILVSVLTLTLTKPYVEKKLLPKQSMSKTNVDALVGQRCAVLTAVSSLEASGEVRLNGNVWSAKSSQGQEIPVGTIVVVERVEGVKVIVSEYKEEIGGKE